jgi:hypothetical protein
MYCTLVGDTDVVSLKRMADGDLAVIVNWPDYSKFTGWVVQRYKSILVMVGAVSGASFPTIFDGDSTDYGCVVRILKAGEIIQIN